jgi:hypothetical protein
MIPTKRSDIEKDKSLDSVPSSVPQYAGSAAAIEAAKEMIHVKLIIKYKL